MKKFFGIIVLICSFAAVLSEAPLWAEEAVTADTAAPVVPAAADIAAPAEPAAPVVAVAPEPKPADIVTSAAVAAPETAELPSTENLEFVSGEITKTDEIAKTVTVKLYGETEDQASEKILTVTLDENTDITDGEKDRDLKSLAASTEVDVEYDPASNKATYIFVY